MQLKTILIIFGVVVFIFALINPGGAAHLVVSIFGLLKEGAVQLSTFLSSLFGGSRGVG
jgi:hypothetical protein